MKLYVYHNEKRAWLQSRHYGRWTNDVRDAQEFDRQEDAALAASAMAGDAEEAAYLYVMEWRD